MRRRKDGRVGAVSGSIVMFDGRGFRREKPEVFEWSRAGERIEAAAPMVVDVFEHSSTAFAEALGSVGGSSAGGAVSIMAVQAGGSVTAFGFFSHAVIEVWSMTRRV